MDSKHKVRIFVTADCLCIFQMFESTFRPDFFLTLTLLCTLYNQLKFFWRMLILRGLNGLEPKKFEFFVTADCFGIFADFKSTFWPYFLKNIILSKCFMRIILKKILFLIFLVKKQSLYLCKFTNKFSILKNSLGSTFF